MIRRDLYNRYSNTSSTIGILLFIAIIVTGCHSVEPKLNEIKIGVLAPLTGVAPFLGEYMVDGFEMALSEINSNGGVNGLQVELIYEDTQCINHKATASGLKKLTEVDQVVAILGPYCGTTNMIATEYFQSYPIFSISPGENFGKVADHKFSTRYLNAREAALVGQHMLSNNLSRIALLYYDNHWGYSYRDGMSDFLQDASAELVATESYDHSNLDVRTQLVKLMDADPDTLLIIDGTQGDLFEQVRELGIDIPLYSQWEIEKSSNEDRHELDGIIYAAPFQDNEEFRKKYKEYFGRELPHVNVVNSYDALMILASGLTECYFENSNDQGRLNNCLSSFVEELDNFAVASGVISFDTESWSFNKTLALKTVQNGSFVVLE